MGPEEPSFVEENVETEVSGERDQTEDEGDQEEDAWTDERVRVKEIFNYCPFTCCVILGKRTKHLLDNLVMEEPKVDVFPIEYLLWR